MTLCYPLLLLATFILPCAVHSIYMYDLERKSELFHRLLDENNGQLPRLEEYKRK